MSFEINTMRTVVTVVSLVLFLGLVIWTWNRRRQTAFDEAANLPFLDDDTPGDAPRQ
jgi:cytochrome c oxidase cbb3-type subunit IV